MATVSTYLNFDGQTEAAFAHYKKVFGTDYLGPITRVGEVPLAPGQTRTEAQKKRIAHMALPITGGHLLRGTDVPTVREGNNVSVMVEPDSRAEAERIYAALGKGGEVVMPLADQPWGAYFAQLVDRFGVQWLVHVETR